jgi:hypothetical protein
VNLSNSAIVASPTGEETGTLELIATNEVAALNFVSDDSSQTTFGVEASSSAEGAALIDTAVSRSTEEMAQSSVTADPRDRE